MNDAISRSAVLNELIEAKSQVSKVHTDYAEIINETLDIFANTINKQPALDVAPVVHARWIMNHFGAKCGNCLRLYCVEPSWSEKIKHMPPTWIYCPNCGAKMDGEAE